MLILTGLINPKVNAFIGSGVVVHIPSLFNELDTLERKGKLYLSRCMDFS
jgi:adenylosuccinate synthase